MRRVAIILFNLGGPDSLQAVRPFLKNLFSDPAIIRAPGPIRKMLASLISSSREKSAQENYTVMGGRSPILFETEAQAASLQNLLNARLPADLETNVIVGMRYWKPYAADAAQMARDWGAKEAILLPLYPQFSSTTTGSAMTAWREVWDAPTRTLCCYSASDKFIRAHANAIVEAWKKADSPAFPRVLFSAHGLPERIVKAGDPYVWQIARTVGAVKNLLPRNWETRTCFQSRVGPVKWIGPATDHEIRVAGRDNAGVIVSPIAFVSEHIETLVELDRDYAHLAKQSGVPFYIRAPALGVADLFIETLADQVAHLLAAPAGVHSEEGGRICPSNFKQCPLPALAAAPLGAR